MFVNFATTKKVIKAPTADTKCYACDSMSVGATNHEGKTVYACKRHADASIKVVDCCIYCGDPVRKGSLSIDGAFAHQKCHDDAVGN